MILCGAMLGSTVDTCAASVLAGFWMNFTLFLRTRGLGSRGFVSPFRCRVEKCAQQMLWVAVHVQRKSHLKNQTLLL